MCDERHPCAAEAVGQDEGCRGGEGVPEPGVLRGWGGGRQKHSSGVRRRRSGEASLTQRTGHILQKQSCGRGHTALFSFSDGRDPMHQARGTHPEAEDKHEDQEAGRPGPRVPTHRPA